MKKLIDRRSVLRGLGGAAIALPMLEAMGGGRRAYAAEADGITSRAADGQPKRLIIMTSRYGTVGPSWQPLGNETAFSYGPILQPLTPFKSKINIISGLDNLVGLKRNGPLNLHVKATVCMLTGRAMVESPAASPGGISIDQVVANQIGAESRFKSLRLAASGGSKASASSAGPRQPLAAEADPHRVFAALFGSYVDPAQRKSVLDGVKDDYGRLLFRVSGQDKAKLDYHLSSIRDVETRLSKVSGASCVRPSEPTIEQATVFQPNNAPAVMKLQIDMLAVALRCDLTRVATLAMGHGNLPFLGFSDDYHNLSHTLATSDTTSIGKITKIYTWYAQQFAYLLGKLNEGDGSLLDSSCVLWISEMGNRVHDFCNVPVVMAGSAGGYFRTGRNIDYGHGEATRNATSAASVPTNNLMVSIQNAMGVADTRFGEAEFCTGALPRLT